MGFLTTSNTINSLRPLQDERTQHMLNWLSNKDGWKRQSEFHNERVPGTGDWFLETLPFTTWRSVNGTPILLCHGEGTESSQIS
jgi:hypothetical protein